jgi:hypothetical protein
MPRHIKLKTTLTLPCLDSEASSTMVEHVMKTNVTVAQAHLHDLERRSRLTLASMKVRAVCRIRYDGITLPSCLLGCKDYFWFDVRKGLENAYCPVSEAELRLGEVPPVGIRRWIYFYEDDTVASTVIPLVWDIQAEDVLRIFEYWGNTSLMSQPPSTFVERTLADAIEESRAGPTRLDAAQLKASPVMLWAPDFEEEVDFHAFDKRFPDRERVHSDKLRFHSARRPDGVQVAAYPPLRLGMKSLMLITQHELTVLKRRPALCNVLMRAAGSALAEWRECLTREEWKQQDDAGICTFRPSRHDALDSEVVVRRRRDAYSSESGELATFTSKFDSEKRLRFYEADIRDDMSVIDSDAVSHSDSTLLDLDHHNADMDPDDRIAEDNTVTNMNTNIQASTNVMNDIDMVTPVRNTSRSESESE